MTFKEKRHQAMLRAFREVSEAKMIQRPADNEIQRAADVLRELAKFIREAEPHAINDIAALENGADAAVCQIA